MRTPFSLGRILGIEINIDASWLIIFLLVTWNLAAGVFPAIHPEWTTALNIFMGIVGSVIFFASLLAHELAHSIMARRRGINVRSITLFVFGGVSNIEREPTTPRNEFLVTIVGPLTSLVLGAIFLLLGNASLSSDGLVNDPQVFLERLSPVSTLLIWLGSINVALGLFNLLPGFPLDGGRVVRSLLWAITGNFRLATRIASWGGQGLAILFMLTGILMAVGVDVPLFGSGLLSGLWLILIGWFLNALAASSYLQVALEEMLKDVPVARVMRRGVTPVPADISLSELVHAYLVGSQDRVFPVMKDGAVIGLVRFKDIRRLPRQDWESTKVRDIMVPLSELEVTIPKENVNEAMRRLRHAGRDELLVVEEGDVVGTLGLQDILLWVQLHAEDERMAHVGARRFWFQRP